MKHRLVPVLVPMLALSGCAVTARGVVRTDEAGTHIVTLEGRSRMLKGSEGRAGLVRYLDGEEIEVSGRRAGGAITVESWTLLEGTHGLQAFEGVLQHGERGTGLLDGRTQAFYTIDRDAAYALSGEVGEHVVIEGYVEGAQAVRVVYYRVLSE